MEELGRPFWEDYNDTCIFHHHNFWSHQNHHHNHHQLSCDRPGSSCKSTSLLSLFYFMSSLIRFHNFLPGSSCKSTDFLITSSLAHFPSHLISIILIVVIMMMSTMMRIIIMMINDDGEENESGDDTLTLSSPFFLLSVWSSFEPNYDVSPK